MRSGSATTWRLKATGRANSLNAKEAGSFDAPGFFLTPCLWGNCHSRGSRIVAKSSPWNNTTLYESLQRLHMVIKPVPHPAIEWQD